jgi:hypothetical protein
MTCKTCQHWDMRSSPQMARHGMATCGLQKNKWAYYPPQHTCERHKKAKGEIVQARETYLGKL